MPGRKNAFRLYGIEGWAVIDILQKDDEDPPQVGEKVLCRHPFHESKRAYVTPSRYFKCIFILFLLSCNCIIHRVETLHKIWWKDGAIRQPVPTLAEVRNRVQESLSTLRQDHLRHLNPTPYKVCILSAFNIICLDLIVTHFKNRLQ